MEELLLKMNLMVDILAKKKQALNQILDITENQETILLQPKSDELMVMFNEMNLEKQEYIQVVLQADDFFQNTFKDIKSNFEHNAEKYKDEVRDLQNKIKEIIDIDVKIRVKEERNKMLLPKFSTNLKIKAPKASKSYMLEQYAKNKNIK